MGATSLITLSTRSIQSYPDNEVSSALACYQHRFLSTMMPFVNTTFPGKNDARDTGFFKYIDWSVNICATMILYSLCWLWRLFPWSKDTLNPHPLYFCLWDGISVVSFCVMFNMKVSSCPPLTDAQQWHQKNVLITRTMSQMLMQGNLSVIHCFSYEIVSSWFLAYRANIQYNIDQWKQICLPWHLNSIFPHIVWIPI